MGSWVVIRRLPPLPTYVRTWRFVLSLQTLTLPYAPRINLSGFVTFFGNAIKTSSAVGLSALRHESHLPGESWVDEYGEGAPTATPVGRDLILTLHATR